MAKPYDYTSPIVTEDGLSRFKENCDVNYVKIKDNEQTLNDIKSIKSQLEGVETTLSGLNTRIGKVV